MNAAATTGKFSDFTYMLSMAKSAAKPRGGAQAVMANAPDPHARHQLT